MTDRLLAALTSTAVLVTLGLIVARVRSNLDEPPTRPWNSWGRKPPRP